MNETIQASSETETELTPRLTVEIPTEIEAGRPAEPLPVCTCPPGCCG